MRRRRRRSPAAASTARDPIARGSSGQPSSGSPVVPLDPPVELVGRTFPRGCDLDLVSLAPYLSGVELAHLVPERAAFSDKENWSIRLRRPLIRLTERDAPLVRKQLATITEVPPDHVLQEYLDRIKPVASRAPDTLDQ